MKSSEDKLEALLLLVIGLVLAVFAYAYTQVHLDISRTYSVPVSEIAVPEGAAAVAEGERLARVRGCFYCHGDELRGKLYWAAADRGIIAVAPNLTDKMDEYTPGEFARAVRHGIKNDATSIQPAMPSFTFYNLSDADMGRIIAYISSLPEQEGYEGRFQLMPVGWLRWLNRKFPPNVAELIDHSAPRVDPAVGGDSIDRGRYLAESICTECHGDKGRLRTPNAPDLVVAGAYPYEAFSTLLRTGESIGGRELDSHMVRAAKMRYTSLTEAEIAALHAYFRAQLLPDP